jgi:NADH dehydrogenase
MSLAIDRNIKPVHRIIVVGGGAGGLELVTRLGDKLGRSGRASITLVDCSRGHLWKPLLHQVASGSMDVEAHELDYLAHAHWHGYRFQHGELIGLDRSRKVIVLAATFDEEGREIAPPRELPYDTLVLAIGSTTNDFGTPGVRENAIALETTQQALKFHRRLVNACIRAHAQPGPVRPAQLHVVIIGAGATGTELAAELRRTTRAVVAYGLERIDPDKDIRITLIEAAPRILSALPERLSDAVTKLLKDLGVIVLTDTKVSAVRPDGVQLADGHIIESELVVWAAGVRGPDLLANLDHLAVSRSNQLVVLPTLQTTRDPDIFAIGDCAACPRGAAGGTVPPRAQAAHQQASHMVKQLRERLDGKGLKEFRYRDFGSLVSLGEYSTIGSLMGLIAGKGFLVEGYFARLMYRLLYKMHERAVHGTVKTTLGTLARAISRPTEPRVKLH